MIRNPFPLDQTKNIFPIISQTMSKITGLSKTILYVPVAYVSVNNLTEQTKQFLQNVDPDYFRPSYPNYQSRDQYILTPPVWGYVLSGPVLGPIVDLLSVRLQAVWRSPTDNKPYYTETVNWAKEAVMVYDVVSETRAATQAVYLVCGGECVGQPHPIDLWLEAGLVDIDQLVSSNILKERFHE